MEVFSLRARPGEARSGEWRPAVWPGQRSSLEICLERKSIEADTNYLHCTPGGSVQTTKPQTGAVSGLELKCQLEVSLYQASKYHQSDFLGGGFPDRNLIWSAIPKHLELRILSRISWEIYCSSFCILTLTRVLSRIESFSFSSPDRGGRRLELASRYQGRSWLSLAMSRSPSPGTTAPAALPSLHQPQTSLTSGLAGWGLGTCWNKRIMRANRVLFSIKE